MMPSSEHIVIDPAIAQGKPIIRGTRVSVDSIVAALGAGMSFEDVQREYDVSADDIRAALLYINGEQE